MLDLARQQVTLGDEHLLVVGVAVEADELHAIEQRPRDGVGDVGRGDEDHVAEVELDLEVVIAERVVLRGVEHLEQCSRRVATPAPGAQLVDLVEQDDGVHRAGLDDGPGDAPRLAADIGAPVPADLGLVAHPAECDAHELATHGPRHGFTEAGLADTWRTDQRHHCSCLSGLALLMVGTGLRFASAAPSVRLVAGASLGARQSRGATQFQLAHGEELDDAILDLVEAVVIGVEHLPGSVEIELVVAARVPRQLEDPIEPRADPGVLGRLLTDALQAVDLFVDCVRHLLRQVELADLGPVLLDDVVVALTQLLADRRQLLAQEVLALLLVDPLGDIGADLCGDLQLGVMILGPGHDQIDALADIDGGQNRRLVGGLGLTPRRHGIGQLARLGDVRRISGSRRLPRSLAISSSTTRSSRAAASTRGVGRPSASSTRSA